MSGPSLDPLELLDRVVAAIPEGEDRPQQRRMVTEVERALGEGSHLAVQGPTGVGKSVAYLLPAIARAGAGVRTVVVTSSRALQDQLARTDLPFLAEALDVPFTFAVLKGRANYVCQAAVAETEVRLGRGPEAQLELDGLADEPELSGAAERELSRLVDWARTTTSGELADLEEPPTDAAWAAVSVGPGECVGASRCSHAEDCFSEQARARCETADIVVVNAHLYAAHVQSGRAVLPEHDVLVIDEAHEFEDAMVGALGTQLSAGRLVNLARVHDRSVAEAPEVGVNLQSAADALADALDGALAEALDDHRSGRLHGDLPDGLATALTVAGLAADRALTGLRDAARQARDSRSATARHRTERAVRTAEGVVDTIAALAAPLEPGQVRWISEGRAGRHTLQLTRIDIADTLRAAAWEQDDADRGGDGPADDTDDAPGADGPTVVLCSATLDPGTAGRLGLDARFVAVDSPFDFRANGLLYVPRLPRPASDDWPDAVAEELAHVVASCGGRTLALFTSHRMLRRSVEAVRDLLPELEILAQGDAPNPVLQRRFLDEEHTSLFATASFWTGISSPGTTCSAVVIDKIPFPVPTDPIVEARCDAVGDDRAFAEVSVPAAGMQLAQGVGRLIRTATDRGVVAVLDPRLAEARYRKRILDLLPRLRRTRERSDLDAFVAGLGLPPPPP
ncbi:MAG: ATP-dependent DNA helicase [Microthrixaceae bacterium]